MGYRDTPDSDSSDVYESRLGLTISSERTMELCREWRGCQLSLLPNSTWNNIRGKVLSWLMVDLSQQECNGEQLTLWQPGSKKKERQRLS